jgi:hypothetical protein
MKIELKEITIRELSYRYQDNSSSDGRVVRNKLFDVFVLTWK